MEQLAKFSSWIIGKHERLQCKPTAANPRAATWVAHQHYRRAVVRHPVAIVIELEYEVVLGPWKCNQVHNSIPNDKIAVVPQERY